MIVAILVPIAAFDRSRDYEIKLTAIYLFISFCVCVCVLLLTLTYIATIAARPTQRA